MNSQQRLEWAQLSPKSGFRIVTNCILACFHCVGMDSPAELGYLHFPELTSMKRLLTTALFTTLAIFPLAATAQSWHYTGALSVPKQEISLTTLDNGTILATGGQNTDMVPHPECEIYNPATASWSLTDPMKIARVFHAVVILKDGRVAAFGGQTAETYDGGNPVQTTKVEIYDPATATWSDGGSVNIARQHHTASMLSDGRILIVGGLSHVSPIADCEIYDPATQTSTMVAPMKQARYEHQATSLNDGRVMVTGGRIGGWNGTFFTESEIYDPATNTWSVVDPMNQARQRGLLIQFSDGSILSAAGRNSSTSTAPGSELFDLSTGHWSSTDPMKQPCTWMGTVLFPGDRLLATGGFIDAQWQSSTDVLCTATTEWYDKSQAAWYYAPTLETARARHCAVYLHQSVNDELPTDMILVGGGITGNNTYTNTCEILDVTPYALGTYRAMPANHPESSVTVADGATSGAVVQYSDGNAIIHFTLPSDGSAKVDLISTDGRVARSYNPSSIPAGAYDLNVGSSSLPSGAYFADVRTPSWQGRLKVMIMH